MANAASVSALQVANPGLGTVSRLPQTSQTPPDGAAPFVRLSRKAKLIMFDTTGLGVTAGTQNVQTLKPVGGYLRGLRMEIIGSGGTGVAAVYAADGPFNTIATFLIRDPMNQPIINVDGYGMHLIDLYSGQYGESGFQPLTAQPSYSAPTSGNFNIPFYIPFELDYAGYCALPSLSAASQPTIQTIFNAQTVPFSTQPTGALTAIEQKIYARFWAAPVEAPDLGPPDLGSSAQWSLGIAPQGVGTASLYRGPLPRVGTYIHTLILALRDSTGVRIDSWPLNDLTFYVDGVPIEFENFNARIDDMYQMFGVTRPTGVVTYSFRDSVEQMVNQSDTHDLLLYTTPATLLEIAGTFQAITNAPAKIYTYTGELYPVGGIPYTHLAG